MKPLRAITSFIGAWRKTTSDLDCYSEALDKFFSDIRIADHRTKVVNKKSANVPIFVARKYPADELKTLFTDGMSGFVLSNSQGRKMRVELSLTIDEEEPDSWCKVLENLVRVLLDRKQAPAWGEVFSVPSSSEAAICAVIRPGLWFEIEKTSFESCGTAFGVAEILILSEDEAKRFSVDEESAQLWIRKNDVDVSRPSRLLRLTNDANHAVECNPCHHKLHT